MRWGFRDRRKPEGKPRHRRIPLIGIILMAIGLMTVLYFLIVWVLIPVLAAITVS